MFIRVGGVPGIGKTQIGYVVSSQVSRPCHTCFSPLFCELYWLFVVVHDIYFHRIQLSVNVQIPLQYGGVGGKAIYIGKSFI